ncbi:sporulation protein YjcZ [Paenibacillus thiaminolyticus]|uniref:Sporulation protein YjcZ n=1 Tax=Paenibacillus thiaminolyticus TaxID=49283 RepID=A0A3A3GPQ9_PANTH|nr:sporulation protein YjcZ [Paenibacillus thiaminolyticus]RJG25192.1 sporulation protein YjcZ [Paenibacillus thiaminolyticus]
MSGAGHTYKAGYGGYGHGYYVGFTSIGPILVLFILLVIIGRSVLGYGY